MTFDWIVGIKLWKIITVRLRYASKNSNDLTNNSLPQKVKLSSLKDHLPAVTSGHVKLWQSTKENLNTANSIPRGVPGICPDFLPTGFSEL